MCSIGVGGVRKGAVGNGRAGRWGYDSFENLANSAKGLKLAVHEAVGRFVGEDCAKQCACAVLRMIDS